MNIVFRHFLRKLYHCLPISTSIKQDLKKALYGRFAGVRDNSYRSPRPVKGGEGANYMLRNFLRTAYFKLPVDDYNRYQIVSTLFRFFPFVFSKFPEFQRWKMLTEKSARPWEQLLKSSENMAASMVITLPVFSSPRISVIIPVYGKVDYTLMCLRSIASCVIKVPFEVIVVNDCSPDNTLDALQEVSGVRVVSNQTNQGFIRSCNLGAVVAQGEYVCFLNNDTQVCDGWLDELLRTFDDFPDVGLAGSKFVYPNGKLQEAGGIIWRDGSAWNFGRDEDPCHPMFSYAREVDYISGASFLIRKVLFDEFGGFDEFYLPAYCEDADLALKIRNRGLKVMYQPLSVVIHYEGKTSGTDIRQGVKSYQVANSQKLFERWHELLESNEPPGGDIDIAKDRGCKRRALVLDICTPTPDRDAGSVVTFNLMRLLSQMGFQVTFIPTGNFRYLSGYTQDLQRAGIEVLYAPFVTSVRQHLRKSGGRYAFALLFRPVVAKTHLSTIRNTCPNTKILYHPADLHYLRMEREAELLGDASKMKAAEQMKRTELAVFRAADASIVHSTTELELLRPELPNEHIFVFPLILDICGTNKPFKARRDIVFIGGYQHPPNIDAVKYFVAEIMPIIRRRLAGVRFYAVGSNPPAEILTLRAEDVVVTGFVKDLHPLLDQMRVSVAPLRYGAGIKGKIGTAMAVGLPAVATSLAAEGMSLTHGENVLVADGAAAFAETIIRLYQDEVLWNQLSQAGLEFAAKTWGAEAAWKILSDILHDIGILVSRGSYPLNLYSPDKTGKSV